MSRIEVSTVVDRPIEEVWADIGDIDSHVTWMSDAVEIRFLTEQRSGAGTRFECDTKVGPIRLTDVMEITDWEEGRSMTVHHAGLVTGHGRLSLVPAATTATPATVVRWEEELSFPWRLGGPLGELAGRPVLARIWKRNLARLRHRIEASPR